MSLLRFYLLGLLLVFAFPVIAPVLCDCPAEAACASACNPSAPHDDDDGCELCIAPTAAECISGYRAPVDPTSHIPLAAAHDFAAAGFIAPDFSPVSVLQFYLPADGSAYSRVSPPLRP